MEPAKFLPVIVPVVEVAASLGRWKTCALTFPPEFDRDPGCVLPERGMKGSWVVLLVIFFWL